MGESCSKEIHESDTYNLLSPQPRDKKTNVTKASTTVPEMYWIAFSNLKFEKELEDDLEQSVVKFARKISLKGLIGLYINCSKILDHLFDKRKVIFPSDLKDVSIDMFLNNQINKESKLIMKKPFTTKVEGLNEMPRIKLSQIAAVYDIINFIRIERLLDQLDELDEIETFHNDKKFQSIKNEYGNQLKKFLEMGNKVTSASVKVGNDDDKNDNDNDSKDDESNSNSKQDVSTMLSPWRQTCANLWKDMWDLKDRRDAVGDEIWKDCLGLGGVGGGGGGVVDQEEFRENWEQLGQLKGKMMDCWGKHRQYEDLHWLFMGAVEEWMGSGCFLAGFSG